MNIVYISNSRIPSKEANSVNVMKMCSALAGLGHQVTLLARQSGADICDYDFYGVKRNFPVVKLWWPKVKGGGLFYGMSTKKFLRKLPHDSLAYGRDVYGLLAASKLGMDCRFEVHTPPRNRFHYKMQQQLFKSPQCKKVIAITNALKVEYLKLFPDLREQDIIVAPDGADVPDFEDSHFKDSPVGGDNDFKVGYVGSLYPGKGMEVIAGLATAMPEIDFHIVGGKDKDIKRWKRRTASANIIFHGFIPHAYLGRYYRNFDIVLAPFQNNISLSGGKGDISRWTSPLKVFEYMSYRKPMIASDLPVIREVLEDGANALLCNPENLMQWRDCIIKLQENRNLADAIAARAFQDLRAHYTWEKRAMKVYE